LQRRPRGILFLEDIGERGYRIDRMLEQMLQSGLLNQLEAIVFGSFVGGADPDGGNLGPRVLQRFAETQRIPVLGGLQAGHGEHQRPLFLRSAARLSCGARPSLIVAAPVFDERVGPRQSGGNSLIGVSEREDQSRRKGQVRRADPADRTGRSRFEGRPR
jgi:hypothetical protein